MGMRKTQLIDDEATINTILEAVELGMTLSKACAFACVSKGAMDRLLDRGARDVDEGIESKEALLFLKVERSRAKFQEKNLLCINKAAESRTWQAAAWLLERRCPEDFAPQRSKGDEIQRIQIISDVKPDAPEDTCDDTPGSSCSGDTGSSSEGTNGGEK